MKLMTCVDGDPLNSLNIQIPQATSAVMTVSAARCERRVVATYMGKSQSASFNDISCISYPNTTKLSTAPSRAISKTSAKLVKCTIQELCDEHTDNTMQQTVLAFKDDVPHQDVPIAWSELKLGLLTWWGVHQ